MSSKQKLFKELEFLGYDPVSIRNVLLTQNTFEGALGILSQNKEQHIRSELIKFGVPVRMAKRLSSSSNTVEEAYEKFNNYLPVAESIRAQAREMGFPNNSAEFVISEMIPLEYAIEKLLSNPAPDENITIQVPKVQPNRNFNYTPPTMNPIPIIPRPPVPSMPPPPTGLPRMIPQNLPGYAQLPMPPPVLGINQIYFNTPPPSNYQQPPNYHPAPNFDQPPLPPPPNYHTAPNFHQYGIPPLPPNFNIAPYPQNHPPNPNYSTVPTNYGGPTVTYYDNQEILVSQDLQSLPRRRIPNMPPPPQPIDPGLNPNPYFENPILPPESNLTIDRNRLGNNFQEAYETVTIAQMNRDNPVENEEYVPFPFLDLFIIIEQLRGLQLITFLGSLYQEEQGVSEEVFKKLNRQNYTIELGLSTDNCVICMEDFELNLEIIILQCKHGFHPDCLESWLKKSELCPLCKGEVTGE